jgi:RNA polymerase sigma factor (sigma-70 family)
MTTNNKEINLWNDFRNGNKEAYECIYRTYAPLLYNYGFKITANHALTQDCIQELFITLLVNKSRISKTDSIKFYLYKSLRRELIRALKNDKKNLSQPPGFEPNFDVVFSYEYDLIQEQLSAERIQSLHKALDSLPPRQKEVIFLRFYENLSFEEIAGVMGIEQASVYKIIYKAIDNLHGRLLVEYVVVLIKLYTVI